MKMNELVKTQVREIAARYPEIQSVLLFGSHAHGDYNNSSNIDLAIKAPKISDIDWLSLNEQLENPITPFFVLDHLIVILLGKKTTELHLKRVPVRKKSTLSWH